MADRRHISHAGYGSPGLLAYIPSENLEKNGPGTLEAQRFSSECTFPHFNIVGPLKTLYDASASLLPESSAKFWSQRRRQMRWLFKTCPDAFVGNTLFRDVFREDVKSTQSPYRQMINDRPLLAVGQARDLGVKLGEALQQIMAVPVGESGQLLRIARMDDSQWQWGGAKDAFVNISTVDPSRKELEATWQDDGLPVIQVKFAAERLPDGVEDWLLVQKETSTTILRPRYSEAAGAAGVSDSLSVDSQPSFISPNPLLTIRHTQTGGRAHADVALIPRAHERPPQLAIVDECGYWIVWDLVQGQEAHRSSVSLDFGSCGHVQEGLLGQMPLTTSHPSRKHGLLFVGPASGRDAPLSDQTGDGTAMERRCLVIWNEHDVVILDTLANVLLPKLGRFQAEDWKQDPVLDIQRDPVRQNYIVMLTRRRILWVDLAGSPGPTKGSPSKPAILLHCPHLGTSRDDSRMFVCRASDEDDKTTLVFVYYPKKGQLCTFWLSISPSASIPQWHRDTISLPGRDESPTPCSTIRYIRVDQAPLAISVKPNASSPGIDYVDKGVVFYQLTVLWDDLRLQHCMCAVSVEPRLAIHAPDTRVEWLDRGSSQQERPAPKASDRMSPLFVLPDGEDDVHVAGEVVAQPRRKSPRSSKPVLMKFDKMCEALQESFDETAAAQGDFGLSSALFHFLRDELDEEHGYERLPLLTWREVAETIPGLGGPGSADLDTEDAVQQLLDQNGERKVVTHLKPGKPDEGPLSVTDLPSLRDYFSRLWLDPVEEKLPEEMQRLRRAWAAEIARDEFLSSYGVMMQDTPLLGAAAPTGDPLEDSQVQGLHLASSQPPRSSIPPSPSPGIMSSSPARPAAPPTAEDGAARRLGMLCSGLDASRLDVSKRSKMMAYWPAERGVDPAEYMSTIVRANEELHRGARERLQRAEARRRARADRYKRPAFMRQGLPDLPGPDRSLAESSPVRPSPVKGAQSSQRVADSSQSVGAGGFAMSQPVAGAFGDRKKAKKAKRKSGFR